MRVLISQSHKILLLEIFWPQKQVEINDEKKRWGGVGRRERGWEYVFVLNECIGCL